MEFVLYILGALVLLHLVFVYKLGKELWEYPLFKKNQRVIYSTLLVALPFIGPFIVSKNMGYKVFGSASNGGSGSGISDSGGSSSGSCGGDGGC